MKLKSQKRNRWACDNHD